MIESSTTLTEDIAATCDAAHDVWQRARREDADRETVAYLVWAYEYLQKAKKADARGRRSAT